MAHALHILDSERFQDVQPIGSGNHAMVFSAWDIELERRVALKLATHDTLLDVFGAERLAELGIAAGLQELVEELGDTHRYTLLREAKLLAKLDHPHVVPILEVGLLDSKLAVVMPLLSKDNLAERSFEGDWRDVLRVAIQIGEGLAALHESGILHRDFKPNNVLFDRHGRALITDLGLACSLDDHAAMAEWPGTREYMAPETRAQSFRDQRDDIYAYCIVVFQMFYGHMPFASRDARVNGRVSKIERPGGIPPMIHEVLTRGLSPAAARRWSNMNTLLEQLRRVEALRLGLPRRWTWFASGAAAAALFGAIVSSSVVQADACEQVEQELDLIWNDQVAAEITGATGSSATGSSLTDWKARYIAVRKQECERSEILEQPPGPSTCMLSQRQVFATTVKTLRQPSRRKGLDFQAVGRGLPEPERCLEPTPDAGSASTGLLALEEIDTEIATLVTLGQLDTARERVQAMQAAAREQNASYVVIRASYWTGRIARSEGELEAAKSELHSAYAAAGNIHDRFLSADIALELTAIAAAEGSPGEADAYARAAMPVFANQHPAQVADLLDYQAIALRSGTPAQRLDSVTLLRESLDQRRQDIRQFGASSESLALTQLELARSLLVVNQNEEALSLAEQSLASLRERQGSGPAVAEQTRTLYRLLVSAQLRLQRYVDASESVSDHFAALFGSSSDELLHTELAWLDSIYTSEFECLDPRVLRALLEYRERKGGGRLNDLPKLPSQSQRSRRCRPR